MLSVPQIVAIIGLGALALGIGALTLYALWQWHRHNSLLSRGHLAVRVVGTLLSLGLLWRVLGGILRVWPELQPLRAVVIYWVDCLVLGWLLLLVIGLDLWLALQLRRAHQQRLGQLAAELAAQCSAPPPPPEPPAV
jgi:hypothetical protein